MRDKISANEFRTTIICVDEYDGGKLSGRIFNPYLKGGESFACLMNLLVGIDDLLDEMRFPQSFQAKRGFVPAPPVPEDREVDASPAGVRATFAVRVLFRQNASWQGSLTWLEGGREESFRSALELVFLIRGALEGGAEKAR
jgi:hypothetical protein